MITSKELDEKRSALADFVKMSNDNDNIEKKRTGVQSIKTELEEACPFVKDYDPYPDFGVFAFIQDFVLYNSHLHEVEGFVDGCYDEIKEYEGLDAETKKKYADKLVEYQQTTSIYYQNSADPHPDRIFTQYGSYRRFYSYQNTPAYKVARKMRGDLEEKGEGDFKLHFRAYMLYNAAANELATIEKTMRRIGYLIMDTTIQKRDAVPDGDPYADVRPFKNPNADPGIYYNFWGASLKKKQEQYKDKDTLTGEQKATFLAPYNYRKLLLELERLFHSVRTEQIGVVPDSTQKEIRTFFTKLFDDYFERTVQECGTSFEVLSEKLASWENRTISASHDAEERVPTIVCYDSECQGETSSSCLQRYIGECCETLVNDKKEQVAFSPRYQALGILRYDFWGDDYGKLVEQHKGKRGLPDDLRALFNQEDNTALFIKKVREFIDQAIKESERNEWNVGTREMADTLAKAKVFYQDQFYKFNERLDNTDLTDAEKNNASLGWIYFTRREVARIRWEGMSYTIVPKGRPDMRGIYFTFSFTGSGAIFDEMKRRFMEDTSIAAPQSVVQHRGRFEPLNNNVFKFDRLYEYLHREEQRVISVSQSDFEYAVYNADFSQIFKDAGPLGSRTKVKCLIQFLKDKFPKGWYTAVSQNSGVSKESLKKINYERDTLRLFKRCIEGIPLT